MYRGMRRDILATRLQEHWQSGEKSCRVLSLLKNARANTNAGRSTVQSQVVIKNTSCQISCEGIDMKPGCFSTFGCVWIASILPRANDSSFISPQVQAWQLLAADPRAEMHALSTAWHQFRPIDRARRSQVRGRDCFFLHEEMPQPPFVHRKTMSRVRFGPALVQRQDGATIPSFEI